MNRILPSVILCLLMLALPIASAIELPFSRSFGPFTLTLTSYSISADRHGGMLQGSIWSEAWADIQVLSAYATVSSSAYLGRVDVQGTPVLKRQSSQDVSVALSSPYTIEEIGAMNTPAVTIHAELRYCVIAWLWCIPIWIPPSAANTAVRCDFTSCTITFDQTLTSNEIATILQEYA